MRNPHLAKLGFNYLWSNPEAGDDVLVCAALVRPRFDDLVALSRDLGVGALRTGWNTLEREGWPGNHTRSIAGWYLEIIENAHRKLAGKNPPTPAVAWRN